MKKTQLLLILLSGCLLLQPDKIIAEGSKEIYINTNNTSLYLCNDFVSHCTSVNGDRSQFAIYGCAEVDRLYMVTNTVQEMVYLGFRGSGAGSNNHIVFRIKDLSGTTVYGELSLPTSGAGYINNINEARVGPTQFYGAGGYNALSFRPTTPGVFYIEFDRVSNSTGQRVVGNFNMDLFDFTVCDTVVHVAKPGRVYSKSWQFQESNDCSAKTYVYSSDSIITSAEFNNMNGGVWIQFCNQWGCYNTGNFTNDRKSLYHIQALLPQYKIFINIPDQVLFPPASTLGQIVPPQPWGERFCDNGHIIFHVSVNKPGNVEIQMSFGAPYVDRKLQQTVVVGENLVDWDGLDGTSPTGIPVPNGTVVTFSISYINGLTNMPFYDVEGNPNGFIISLVSPSGSTPTVYWDDTNIPGGTNNTVVGCVSPPGCHTWSNSGGGWGNLNTINTYWYNVSTSTAPATIVEFRRPQTLTFIQTPPQSYCPGATNVTFSVTPDPNTNTYSWSYTGTGATITQINPTDPFISVNFSTNATSGSIQVYGMNTNCTNPGPTSSLAVSIKPMPGVNPPFTKSICSGTSTSISLSSTPPGSSFSWNSPVPTCTPNITTCPPGNTGSAINDVLSVSNLNSGTVTYHVTPTLDGCSGTVQDIVVTVNPLPDVLTSPATTAICSGGTTNIQLSSTVPSAVFNWTAVASSPNVTGYSSPGSGNIQQTIFNSGFSTETVTYSITPTVNGCSPSSPTNYIVTVYPVPNLSNAPSSKSICNNTATGVTLTSNVTGAQFTWTCTPSSGNVGGYSNNATPTTTLNQVLTNSGFSIESVTYHVTPTANGCNGTVTDYTVTVYPVPNLSNSPLSKSQCNNLATGVTLTSNVTGTQFTWTCVPSGPFITGWANQATPTTILNQTLQNSSSVNQTVTYQITPAANGCSGSVTNYVVTVFPTATLTNSPPSKSQCNNLNTNVILTSNVAGTQFTWTCVPSSGNITGWSDNSTPTTLLNQTLVNSGFINENVIYQVTPIANGCQGTTSNYTVTVYPTPDLTFTPPAQTLCSGQTSSVGLSSNVSGTTFAWTAVASSPTVTGYSAGSGIAIAQTLSNSGTTIETVTYTVTPTANACSGPALPVTVTVNPVTHVTNSPLTQSICSGGTAILNLTADVTGTTFSWTAVSSSPNITGYSNGSGPLISQLLTNSGYTIETVTYAITPTANGCNGPVSNFVVTVKPIPNVSNNPMFSAQCNALATNIVLQSNVAGTTFSWTATPSAPSLTGWSAGGGPVISQTLTNSGYTIETVTYHITPTANLCSGSVYNYVVTVFPTPNLSNTPLSQAQCNNQNTLITLGSNVAGTLFTWNATGSSPAVTGYSNSVAPGVNINQVLVNSGFTTQTVTYQITPQANGCNGSVYSYVVTVFPTPNLSNSPLSKTQCNNQNTNITLTSNVAGTLFTWTAIGSSPSVTGYTDSPGPGTLISDVLINSGFTTETVTYSITPHANNCDGPEYDYTVTVYPTPDLTFTPPAQTLCSGQTSSIGLSSNVSGTTFAWTAVASSPTVTGYSAGSGITIAQSLSNSGTTIETVTYTVTPTANACSGPALPVTVTVNPVTHVTNSPLTQSICSGGTAILNLTADVTGTTFSWTAVSGSPNITGYSNGSGPLISQLLTNSGYTIETVTYAITPTANGCSGPVSNFVVTVKPIPNVSNNPMSSAQCNALTTNIVLQSNVAGTTFSWTATPSAPSLTGWSAGGGPVISQTLTNSGYTIETVTYHITPTANLCSGSVYNYVVTVFPTPNLSNTPLSQAQCNNQNTLITLGSNVAGTLFTWTATGSSPAVTGYSNSVAPGININQVLVNSGFTTQTVTYQITPQANGCNGSVYSYVVTVFPTPNLSNSPLSKSQCNNLNTNITLTSNVTGTLFTWTAIGSSPSVTGYTDSPGPGTLISDILINSGFTTETVTYTITPRANNCDGPEYDYTVTVYPTPDLAFTPPAQTLCSGQTSSIGLSSNVSGTTFAWTAVASSPNVTGYSPGSGITIAQSLSNSGTTIETVTYTVTPTANACNGPALPVTVTVNPVTHVTNSPLTQSICSGGTALLNLTADVTGTTFAWTAVSGSPNITGYSDGSGPLISQVLTNSGYTIETVTYAITPTANGCSGPVSNFVVTVKPIPDVSNNPMSSSQCNNVSTNLTLLSNVSGTAFSWTATPSSANIIGWGPGSGGVINQVLVNTGFAIETVTYHITPTANGCTGSVYDYVVTVVSLPDVYFSPPAQTICDGQATSIQVLSHVGSATFTWTAAGSSPNLSGYSNGSGPFIGQTIANSGNTIETVTYTAIPTAFGCPPGNPQSVVVTVNPTPHVNNNPPEKSICSGANTNITLTSTVTGTTYSWIAIPSSPNLSGYSDNSGPMISQTLVNSGFTIETVTYQVTPTANGCTGPDSNYVVTVFPVPDLSNSPPSKAICNGQFTGVTLISNVAGTQFTWTATGSSGSVSGYSNNAIPTTTLNQVLFNSGYNSETVTYHLTPIANGCNGQVTDYTVTVYPVPNLSNTPPAKAICNGQSTGVTLLSNVAGTLFTWTATGSSGSVSGYSNNAIPTATLNQTLFNSGYNIETVTYHVTPQANGCNGTMTDYIVTVYPVPNLSNSPPAKAICNGQSTGVTLLSNVSGTLFTWTATGSSGSVSGYSNNAIPATILNQTLFNSGYNIETVTYHVTPQANGCNGIVWDYIVTVYPVPDVSNNPMNQSQCNNTYTAINLTSHVANTLFTWTASSSSPLVTGYSNNTTTPVTLINQQLVNPTFVNQTVTYAITPQANGCNGIVWNYTVTIFPTPNLSNSPAAKSQCNNTATGITLTSNVSGTLFTWTTTASSPQLSGFSNNAVPTVTLNQTLVNSGYTIETVTYQITPAANGCNGPVTNYVVTVFPTPNLSNSPAASQVCNNTPTGVTLTSNVAGTQFTWTCTPSSGNITGWSNNSTPTTSLNQTLLNTGLFIETVTYHLTPSANGCLGPVTDYVVTVVQSPDVYFSPPAQTICSEATSSIQILSHVPGTTFTWTTTASSPNLSGYSNGSGDLIAQSVTNSGNTIQTVTYTVSPTAWGCPPGASQNVILTVNPEPHVTNPILISQICSSASTSIYPQSSVANSTYTWTASGSSGNVTGYSNGSGMMIIQQLVNTGFNLETVTYQVTPIANSCYGDAIPFTVTVFPVPDVYFTPAAQAICSGQTSNVSILSHVAGATFTWTASGSSANVSGYSAGSGNLIQQTLFNSLYNIERVTYLASPTANGCPGISGSVVVTVNPLPVVDLPACTDVITTTSGQPIRLRGGIPLGGTYSGTGVSSGIFYPGMAGAGIHWVYYTYVNSMGCTRNDSINLSVVDPIPLVCGNSLTDIRDGKIYPTVQLGTQCWMAANLNYGNVIASTLVQRDNCQFEKYCLTDNPANCNTYGGMYQWDELMNYGTDNGAQGFCPPGWHVPTEADWNTLFGLYISNGFAGNALKSSGYSGFNALVDGVRFHNSVWKFLASDPVLRATILWSSTQRGPNKAWAHGLNEVVADIEYTPSVSFYPSSRINAFSLRCIKD